MGGGGRRRRGDGLCRKGGGTELSVTDKRAGERGRFRSRADGMVGKGGVHV